MELGLAGRVALVTGASSGLGEAIARELAAEGASVAIVARRADVLGRVAATMAAESHRRVLPLAGDVTDAAAMDRCVREAVETLGPIDILVANAGGPPPVSTADADAAQYRSALELTLLSGVALARQCVPAMRARRWGRVIFLVSIAAKMPLEGLVLSTTARAGLVGFAKALATECAPDGVLVNSILTGYFDTARARALAAARAERAGLTAEGVAAEQARRVPLGRLGEPRELAAVVAFLASERASFVTGVALQVDGGQVPTIL